MDYTNYRELLGISFNDEEKNRFFYNNIFSYFDIIKEIVKKETYFVFCMNTGTRASIDDYCYDYYEIIVNELSTHTKSIEEFLFYYLAFANEQKRSNIIDNKEGFDFIKLLKNQLNNAHISYEVFTDEDGTFLFPKGIAEFDKALVTDVLLWLKAYPNTERAWQKALRAYVDANEDNASDIADMFRKALECFFKEFFVTNKSIENCKKEYGDFLKVQGVSKEISNNLETILSLYTNFNNNYAKHADKTEPKILEYIMYSTGNIIRLLISLKQIDEDNEE